MKNVRGQRCISMFNAIYILLLICLKISRIGNTLMDYLEMKFGSIVACVFGFLILFIPWYVTAAVIERKQRRNR